MATLSAKESVSIWLDRLKAGDEQAAEYIWKRYFAQVLRVARNKLGALPPSKADPEDVATTSMKSFMRAVARQNLPQLDSREDLWRILYSMTTRKAIDELRRQGAARRRADAVPIDQAAPEQLLSREPDPHFATLVKDEFDTLMGKLPDDALQLRSIVLLKLEGNTNEEISRQCRCSLRTVERRLFLIRQIWEQAMAS